MKTWTEKYTATHLSRLPKYKEAKELDFYVYDKLLGMFIRDFSLDSAKLTCKDDNISYNGIEIGVCSLRRSGYIYNMYIAVTEEFSNEYEIKKY